MKNKKNQKNQNTIKKMKANVQVLFLFFARLMSALNIVFRNWGTIALKLN